MFKFSILPLIAVLVCLVSFVTLQTNQPITSSEPAELDILPPGYNPDLAPVKDYNPVKVTVSVIFLNIRLSSDASQTFTADIFFHNNWTDHRLRKPTNMAKQMIKLSENGSWTQYKLNDEWRKKLWTPDTYFRNAIEGHKSNILTPTSYFIIKNYNEIFMAVRIGLKLSCAMNFEHFPFDKQTCFINITSTSEEIDILELEWDQFRIGNHVDRTEFEIIAIDQDSCTKEYDVGTLSCLYGTIEFKRNIGNYMIKRFIPSSIIVILTFMGFWIPTTIGPARISLSITALLALITQQIQSDLNVSYVYALQVWNAVCIVFVFASLLEFAIALYMMHMEEKKKKKKNLKDIEIVLNTGTTSPKPVGFLPKFERSQSASVRYVNRWKARLNKHFRTTTRHSSVDNVSRYLFPIGFIIFIICFLSYVRKI